MQTLFTKTQLDNAVFKDIHITKTSLFLNENNTFQTMSLPDEIQYSSIYALEVADVNNDKILDIICGGNQYLIKPQFGRQDASTGWLLLGDKNKDSKIQYSRPEALKIKGQIRDLKSYKIKNKTYIITLLNNDKIRNYEFH